MIPTKAWSKRGTHIKGRNLILAGVAYPKVLQGENPTDVVKGDPAVASSFYNDDAVRISDANLGKLIFFFEFGFLF
jgi:hypothetical protein